MNCKNDLQYTNTILKSLYHTYIISHLKLSDILYARTLLFIIATDSCFTLDVSDASALNIQRSVAYYYYPEAAAIFIKFIVQLRI